MPKLRNVLKLIREISNDFAIPYNVTCWLATQAPKSARRRAEIVEREMARPPKGISPASWASATARHPDSVDKRMHYLERTRAFFAMHKAVAKPLSHSSGGFDGKPIDVPDATSVTEILLFGSVEEERAQEVMEILIDASGFNTRQAQQLLAFFDEVHQTVPPEIEQLLSQLRQTAEKGVPTASF